MPVRKPNPDKPREIIYRLIDPFSASTGAWTVVELAKASGVDIATMQHRLDNWSDDDIMDALARHYEETPEYRTGKPLQPRKWLSDPLDRATETISVYEAGGRQRFVPIKSAVKFATYAPPWCVFHEPWNNGYMAFESELDWRAWRREHPHIQRGPGRPRKSGQLRSIVTGSLSPDIGPKKRHRRASPRVLTPPGHKCVYGLRQELIGKRDPAPDWARFLVPCAQGVMAFEGEDDAAIYRLLQADASTKY